MSQHIRCDECGNDINQRSAGWRTRITRRFDHEQRDDFCSSTCEALHIIDDLNPADAARKELAEALERRRTAIAVVHA